MKVLSFASFRRVATMIMVPGGSGGQSTMEMVFYRFDHLSMRQRIDAARLRVTTPLSRRATRHGRTKRPRGTSGVLVTWRNNARRTCADRQALLETQLLFGLLQLRGRAAARRRLRPNL